MGPKGTPQKSIFWLLKAKSRPKFSTSTGNNFWKSISSTGFYRCCAPGASAPVVVKNQSPIYRRIGFLEEVIIRTLRIIDSMKGIRKKDVHSVKIRSFERGWRTEGVGARRSFPCQRFSPFFCNPKIRLRNRPARKKIHMLIPVFLKEEEPLRIAERVIRTNAGNYRYRSGPPQNPRTKSKPKEEVLGRISLRTSGQKLGQAIQILEKRAFRQGHPARTSTKKLQSENFGLIFRSFKTDSATHYRWAW